MTTGPQVWHYRLVAETWAHFNHDVPELPYYQAQIGRFGQPVLDLGCGTGRVLLPLLQAGFDIDGCDISADMLIWAEKHGRKQGLSPTLVCQPMAEFNLPRRYQTIYICSSFGLAGGRNADLETLKRCYQHLEPGGALLVNIEAEYNYPEAWATWLKENRQALPKPWPEEGRRRVAKDGHIYVSRSRMVALDPLEQSYTREMRIEKWQGETKLAEEEYTLTGQMYFANEMDLALRLAGFDNITAESGFSGQPATADDSELMFVAIK